MLFNVFEVSIDFLLKDEKTEKGDRFLLKF